MEWKGTSGSWPIGHQHPPEKCEIPRFLDIKSSFLGQNSFPFQDYTFKLVLYGGDYDTSSCNAPRFQTKMDLSLGF